MRNLKYGARAKIFSSASSHTSQRTLAVLMDVWCLVVTSGPGSGWLTCGVCSQTFSQTFELSTGLKIHGFSFAKPHARLPGRLES